MSLTQLLHRERGIAAQSDAIQTRSRSAARSPKGDSDWRCHRQERKLGFGECCFTAFLGGFSVQFLMSSSLICQDLAALNREMA